MKKTPAIVAVLSLGPFVLPILAFAQGVISISSNIPGVYNVSSQGPCGWIESFYNFTLLIAGVLALGAVVFGGIKYAISVGNPSKQSEGRSWIWSALIGILLLGSAYLILNTISPNLTKCSFPVLSGVSYTASSAGTSGGTGTTAPPTAGGTPTAGTCASGQCQTLPNCTQSSNVNCGGSQGMVNTLNCIQSQDSNFSVTEGYPPTDQNAAHLVGGHSTGCAVDVVVSNAGAGTCANVQSLLNAEANCGVSNINNNDEYYTCPGGHQYGQTTGQNVHINSAKGGGC